MTQTIFELLTKRVESFEQKKSAPVHDINHVIKLMEQIALKDGFIWQHGETEHQAVEAIFNNRGALLIGNKGTGKTTLLRLAYKAWKLAFNSGGFVTATKLSLQYQTIGAACILQAEKIPLFLDDAGIEEMSSNSFGSKIDPIATLFFLRAESKSPTFVTSNLTIEEFKNRYGERLADKFKQMFKVIIFRGESKR